MQNQTVYEDVKQLRALVLARVGSLTLYHVRIGITCQGNCVPQCAWCDAINAQAAFLADDSQGPEFELYSDPSLDEDPMEKRSYFAAGWFYYRRHGSVYRFRAVYADIGIQQVIYYDAFTDELWWNRSPQTEPFSDLYQPFREDLYVEIFLLTNLERRTTRDQLEGKTGIYHQ